MRSFNFIVVLYPPGPVTTSVGNWLLFKAFSGFLSTIKY